VTAGRETVDRALEAAGGLNADKGTNLLGALEAALGQVPADGPTDVVFLTDGLPTVGERDPARILERARASNEGRARLFTFGVGHDVNVTFLDRLALDARGFPIAVRPSEDVEVAVSTFFRAITSPALTGLSVRAEGGAIVDVYPKDLPDLFRGSTLTVMGRYRGEGKGRLVLAGKRGEVVREVAIPLDFGAAEPAGAFLPALWGARRIGHLIDDVRAFAPDEPESSTRELIDEIVALARRHGIVTEYTAFLLDLDTEDPAEVRRRAREAFRRAAEVQSGAWAQSQARNKEAMKRAGGGRQTTGYEDEQGRYVDLSERVARIGSRVFLRGKDGVWVDTAVPRGVPSVVLRVDGEAYARLVASSPEFARIAALGAPSFVFWEGQVLRLEDTPVPAAPDGPR
jgi:Ca-activated chloride channel family protein